MATLAMEKEGALTRNSSFEFWKEKRVLITGHTGFKGSWLVALLKKMGAKVGGYALAPSTSPNLFTAADLENQMDHHCLGDLRDPKVLGSFVREFQPDVVFHMGAQPLVRYSYAEPIETFETNVMGTAYLLESLRQVPQVRSIVVITTDKCYENREWCWGYREIDPLGGYDPYSSSKACAELVTSAMRRSFFQSTSTALASARAGNVIGGGDWSQDRLIPDLVRTLAVASSSSPSSLSSSSFPLEIRNPNSTRPWQHVLEPLSGYLILAEKLYTEGQSWAEAWNFGPPGEDIKTVGDLVKRVKSLWGLSGKDFVDERGSGGGKRPHPHEAHLLSLDCSKARSRLGWNPVWNVQTALEKTIHWYKSYYAEPHDALQLMSDDIESYWRLAWVVPPLKS